MHTHLFTRSDRRADRAVGPRTRRVAAGMILLAGVALGAHPGIVAAGTTTTTFGVSATVIASCQVTAN